MPKLASRFVLIVAAILASASLSPSAIVKAQSTKERETFDVASIRRASSTSNRLMRGEPSGFTATDVTALDLIKYAFEVIERDVVGELPGWVKTTRFDVVARTANGPLTARRLGAMTRALLADRFRLDASPEQGTGPVFALVRERSDGKTGPYFRPSESTCPVDAPLSAFAPMPRKTLDLTEMRCRHCYVGRRVERPVRHSRHHAGVRGNPVTLWWFRSASRRSNRVEWRI